ncbi:MAG: glucosaminidase domain-containing protein [Muribaculaceae bacterium]|nr:glucosaminidase domain-containing protein [Muribaculaceae bacterium]
MTSPSVGSDSGRRNHNIISRFCRNWRGLAAGMLCILSVSSAFGANHYEEYIEKYAEMAIDQMNTYGVPASITLAQGLLESAAGRSTLAREGNNHFGIKCHKEWNGRSMLRNDDKPNECFRVYNSAAESFKDHSLFLRRNRYASLFDLDIKDYNGWARGLKKCGYATDPNYAARLISIIELYQLNRFDSGYSRQHPHEAAETAEFIHKMLQRKHVVRRNRGLHYVIAQPGDTYGKIALELNVKASNLLKYNDVEKDGEIKPWEEVYLQEKLEEGPATASKATIGEGESFHSLAQRYGIKLSTLRRLNPNTPDRPGETLRLQ